MSAYNIIKSSLVKIHSDKGAYTIPSCWREEVYGFRQFVLGGHLEITNRTPLPRFIPYTCSRSKIDSIILVIIPRLIPYYTCVHIVVPKLIPYTRSRSKIDSIYS